MWRFLLIFCIFGFPVFVTVAVVIWSHSWLPKSQRSIADRIAWTVFALGIFLMLTMVLYAMGSESDGDFRSWDTIRLHSRLFLAIAHDPARRPAAWSSCTRRRGRVPPGRPARNSPVDDLSYGPS